jgi:hypothetical protein
MTDRVPYQLIDLGNEADIFTWDNSGEPTVIPLAIGDFVYRNAAGALTAIGSGAAAGEGLVSDGAGGWSVGAVAGGGGGGAGGAFTAEKESFVEGVDYAAGGGILEIELATAPPGATPAEQEKSIIVSFGGVIQPASQYSITDNITPTEFRTITFTSAIPEFLSEIEVTTLTRPIASSITFDPALQVGPPDIVTATDVQGAIDELDAYLVALDATQVDFDDTILASGSATNVQEAIDAIATTPGLVPTSFGSSLVLIEDQRAQGVDGGDATEGGWFARPLNTITDSVVPFGAGLAANQITLPDGDYIIEFMSVFNTDDQGPLGNVRTRLYNVTDAATEILSMSNTVDGGATIQGNANSCGYGRITVAGGPKTFELQYQVEFTRTGRGLGSASNMDTEIYALIKIWQL